MNTKMRNINLEFPLTITKVEYNRLHKTNKNALQHIKCAVERDTLLFNKKREKLNEIKNRKKK